MAVVFGPFFFAGQVFVPGDFLPFIYPWRAYQDTFPHNIELFDVAVFFYPQDVFYNASLKEGVLPLWNPHIFAGHPAIASGQSGFLYPPRLLLHYFLTPAVAKTYLQFLHLFGMGLAMHGFLKIRGYKLGPCILGALVWMGNSYVASWLEFEHVEIAGMYLPLMLICLEKALAGGARWWLLMPIFGALSLHSGHLQINLYTGLILIVYSLIRIWQKREWKNLFVFAAVGLFTICLSAPTVFPFLELLRESQRVALDPVANAASLPTLLLSILNPDIWGNPSKGFLFNRCQANLIYPEFACFVGMVPVALALSARGREARVLQVLCLLCLVLASASFSITLPLLDRFIPGRVLFVLVFCLANLAALGAQQVGESETAAQWCKRLGIALGLLWSGVLAFVLYALWNPSVLLDWWAQNPRGLKLPPVNLGEEEVLAAFVDFYTWNPQLLLPLLACFFLVWRPRKLHLLIAVTAIEMALFSAGFNTSVSPESLFPKTPEIELMQKSSQRVVSIGCANYNTLTPYQLSLVNGYESLVSGRYSLALSQAEPERPLPMRSLALERLDFPMVDALSVEYALLPPFRELSAPGWELVKDGEGGKVYKNSESLPRATLLGSVLPLTELAQLHRFQPSKEAFVSKAPPQGLQAGEGKVRWLEESANRLLLEVETQSTQLLLLTDSYHPGWKCWVDGLESEVLIVNMASRGVYLSPGLHRVEFRFEPASFILGRNLCFGALLLLLLLALALGKWEVRKALPGQVGVVAEEVPHE